MRLGVFGGTFDPPHLGHLILAEQARHQLKLEKVLWVPAGDQPLKEQSEISAVADRVEMVRLAIEANADFELSRVDVDRPGPHYTVDMLSIVADTHSDVDLFLLLGSDSVADLPEWHAPERLTQIATLAMLPRPGADPDIHALESVVPGLSEHCLIVDGPLLEISATAIRRRVQAGESIRYMVPSLVERYIYQQNLYQLQVA